MRSHFFQILFSLLTLSADILAQTGIPTSELSTSSSLSKALNGRSYFHSSKNFSCRSNDPNHTVIKSWKNKIEFKEDRILIWGNLCNDSAKSIPFPMARSNLFVSSDLKLIVYKKQVLVYKEKDPELCPEGQWCPLKREKL